MQREKTLVRELEPSADPQTVERRHELTSAAVEVLAGDSAPELAGIRDIRTAADRSSRGGLLRPDELRSIAVSVRVALEARRVLREPVLAVLLEPVDPRLGGLAGEIDRRIEEDGSDVRDNASPLLRKLRNELRNGGARLPRWANPATRGPSPRWRRCSATTPTSGCASTLPGRSESS